MPHRNRIVPNQGVLIFSRRVLCSAHKWEQVPNLLIKEQAFHFAQSVNRKREQKFLFNGGYLKLLSITSSRQISQNISFKEQVKYETCPLQA